MPRVPRADEKYSIGTGLVYIFNLIVGTGALALPGALQRSGYICGVLLLLILALFSYVTASFIVESLAAANALSRKRYQVDSRDVPQSTIERTPLVHKQDAQDGEIFEITEKYEIGQMSVLMSPKWCQIIIYFCLCLYLSLDLAIYEVVLGRTGSHIICTFRENVTKSKLDDMPCWSSYTITRINVYRITVTVFVFLLGPFVFFNLQKTKVLQILTTCLRWLAFFIMIIWAIYRLHKLGKQGSPPLIDFKEIPTLFGTVVYSFMCQHSIPGLVQPIGNKKRIKQIMALDYVLASVFYISLSLTAIFAFDKIEDIYALNFLEEASEPHSNVFKKILAYYLALFPIFTLSTSFPIIGITLRNNLRALILRNSPYVWYYDRLLFPLLTLVPPTILAVSVSDIQLLLGIVGSYAGAFVQYLIPCLLVHFARSQVANIEGTNIYASPFKSKYFLILVYIWMLVTLVLITFNYVLKFRK